MSALVSVGHPRKSSLRIVITGNFSSQTKQKIIADVRALAKTYKLKYKQVGK